MSPNTIIRELEIRDQKGIKEFSGGKGFIVTLEASEGVAKALSAVQGWLQRNPLNLTQESLLVWGESAKQLEERFLDAREKVVNAKVKKNKELIALYKSGERQERPHDLMVTDAKAPFELQVKVKEDKEGSIIVWLNDSSNKLCWRWEVLKILPMVRIGNKQELTEAVKKKEWCLRTSWLTKSLLSNQTEPAYKVLGEDGSVAREIWARRQGQQSGVKRESKEKEEVKPSVYYKDVAGEVVKIYTKQVGRIHHPSAEGLVVEKDGKKIEWAYCNEQGMLTSPGKDIPAFVMNRPSKRIRILSQKDALLEVGEDAWSFEYEEQDGIQCKVRKKGADLEGVLKIEKKEKTSDGLVNVVLHYDSRKKRAESWLVGGEAKAVCEELPNGYRVQYESPGKSLTIEYDHEKKVRKEWLIRWIKAHLDLNSKGSSKSQAEQKKAVREWIRKEEAQWASQSAGMFCQGKKICWSDVFGSVVFGDVRKKEGVLEAIGQSYVLKVKELERELPISGMRSISALGEGLIDECIAVAIETKVLSKKLEEVQSAEMETKGLAEKVRKRL